MSASNRSSCRNSHLAGDAVLRGVLVGFLDPLRVDVDADGARAELGRGDDDAAVAAPEVVDHVVGADLRGLEHRVDDQLRASARRSRRAGARSGATRPGPGALPPDAAVEHGQAGHDGGAEKNGPGPAGHACVLSGERQRCSASSRTLPETRARCHAANPTCTMRRVSSHGPGRSQLGRSGGGHMMRAAMAMAVVLCDGRAGAGPGQPDGRGHQGPARRCSRATSSSRRPRCPKPITRSSRRRRSAASANSSAMSPTPTT